MTSKLPANPWSTPVVPCTVDTVLGLVQNNKRGLFAWPALAERVAGFFDLAERRWRGSAASCRR